MNGISRVAFTVFGFPIYWYGLLIAAGLMLALVLGMKREKGMGLPKDLFLDFILRAMPIAIVCARIYYVVFSWDLYRDNLLSVFNVRQGGLAIYGGVIGGCATAVIFAKRRRISFGKLADLCAPSLALGQAIGRWGNFFNQEAYGVVITDERLCFFPLAVFIDADGAWHAAAFFYESAWCFMIVAALLVLEKRGVMKRDGDLFGAYAFLYAAERVVVEGLRLDSLWLGTLRISQILSAAAMLGVMLWLVVRSGMGERPAWPFAVGCLLIIGLIFAVHLCPVPVQIILALGSIAACAVLYGRVPRTAASGEG